MQDGARNNIWEWASMKRAIEILRERKRISDASSLKYEYDANSGLLNKELKRLPNAFSLIHDVLQECVDLQSCKQIKPSHLSELIMNCQKESPDAWVGEYDEAVWSYGDSPSGFYLKWVKKYDQCELLRYWLTESARSGQLAEIFNLDEIPKYQLVAAEFVVDKCWYRATILRALSREVVSVLFVDYGNIELCYVHQLRLLPEELREPGYFAFKAKLSYIGVPDDHIEGTHMLMFSTKLKKSKRILCQIVGVTKGIEGFEVALFKQDGSVLHQFPPPFSYFSEMDQDPESFFPLSDTYPLPHEVPLLVHKSEELHLQSRPWTSAEDYTIFSVVTVIDPSEIYVKKNEDIKADTAFKDRLNDFYGESSEWVDAYRIKTKRIFKNRLYAWYNRTVKSWERVRVVRVDMPVGKCYVQRVDYGDKLVVSITDMMEMSTRFCNPYPLVESAHLVHIKPINGQVVWSQRACDDLNHIFKLDCKFLGVLFNREVSSQFNTCARWKSLGLLLKAASTRVNYSVQGLMVELGMAEATGIGAGNPNLIFEEQRCPRYSSITNQNQNGRNTINKETFKCTLRDQTALGTSMCPFKIRGDEDELLQMGKIPPSFKEDQSYFLHRFIRECLGWVNFTQLCGPGHFYLQMENKKDELFKLMSDLEKHITDVENPNKIIPGDFVAVLYVHEIETNFLRTWNRAFVLETNSKLCQAKVILIDFGIETLINYHYIRRLPLKFTEQVPYCQRAHLDVPNNMPTGSKNCNKAWSSMAKHNFNEYILKWSVECPVYLAYSGNVNHKVVLLNEFNEELVYDIRTGHWVIPNKKKKSLFEQTSSNYTYLNSAREHHLLRNFFTSIGVQVYYEVDKDTDGFYRYEPVWSSLVQNGLMIRTP